MRFFNECFASIIFLDLILVDLSSNAIASIVNMRNGSSLMQMRIRLVHP
jgi:hypothetical protein